MPCTQTRFALDVGARKFPDREWSSFLAPIHVARARSSALYIRKQHQSSSDFYGGCLPCPHSGFLPPPQKCRSKKFSSFTVDIPLRLLAMSLNSAFGMGDACRVLDTNVCRKHLLNCIILTDAGRGVGFSEERTVLCLII